MKKKTRNILLAVAGFAAIGMIAGPAMAQRDPAYQAARQAGQVGEKMDGYLAVVGSAPAAVQALVKDLNIKRKDVYTREASKTGVTVEEFAFGAGCKNIRDTVSGEKYQAPGGGWQTRTSAPPQRDPRCP